MTRCRRNPAASILAFHLCWCFATVTLTAQETAPLGEIPLPPTAIAVELSDATIRIVTGGTHEPELRWWRHRQDTPGSAELSVAQDGDAIVVERGDQLEGELAARLLIEIAMPRGKALTVHGSNLDLTVEKAPGEETEIVEPTIPAVATEPPVFEIHLANSQAILSGIHAIIGAFQSSEVEIRETTGKLDIELAESELRIVSHHGLASVVAQASDFKAESTTGNLTVRATGGSVDLRSVQGSFRIDTQDSHIQIIDSAGSGTIAITDSSVDLRNSRIQNLNFNAVSSHATIATCEGRTTMNISGGTFVADNLVGALKGALRDGATIEITDQSGDIDLSLQTESSAGLYAIQGGVAINSIDAELTVQGAEKLSFSGVRSRASLSAISNLEAFQATASDIDLDLSQCRNRTPVVTIQAESYVRIRLATPCRVQAKGLSASLARNVEVSGCELKLGSSGRWATGRARGIDGQPPITLNVQIAESAELIVDGHP